jgi:hypothetical protein
MLEPVLDKGREVFQVLHSVRSPVLFLHSIDDQVACYKTTVEAVRKMAPEKVHLVTLRNQNHWIQFDLHPAAIREVADSFFEMTNSQLNDTLNEKSFERLTQANEEARHWARVVLQIFAGFVTLFGALLAISIETVLNSNKNAPLMLSLYSALLSGYVIMVSVYFFYLVRAEVYLKHHIEPLFSGLTWATFRTTQFASGKVSRYFTQFAAIPMTVLPLIGAFFTLGSALLLLYYDPSFSLSNPLDPLPILGVILSILLSFGAVLAVINLLRFTQKELYGMPRPLKMTLRLSEAKHRLHATTTPAAIKQPTIEASDLTSEPVVL